jgi:Fe(3+) dicitrate transport protein
LKISQLSLGISSILMGVVFTSSAAESTTDASTNSIEQITILGSTAAVSKLPGSGAYIGKEILLTQLQTFSVFYPLPPVSIL